MLISQFIASFTVGYTISWQLSLVLTAMLPLLGIGGWFMARAMDQGNASNKAYVDAGAMSQEILKEIKTVASFANFEHEKEKYSGFIEAAMKAGLKQGFKAGFGIGFIVFVVYNSYALAVGYGSNLIANKSTNINTGKAFGAGDVITVLFSIIFGCFSLGQATPYINAILAACNAAKGLFALLARKPEIDLSQSKLKPDKSLISGRIIFKNVSFAYPSKPNNLILDGLDLVIEPGEKVAIVGESGSGKSTVLSLMERLYDSQSGDILFDDFNSKTLDLEYLRSLIGYVPQTPVLLNTSIKENIIFGRTEISEEDIENAIKNASAKDFVDQKGLEYNVGAGGKMLSGGQKQRIAIARAIVNKPKILILDEATSALDNKTEKEVQNTLDRICKGISSITVAHRISTIQNADKIVCLDAGKIVEQGTHKELLAKNGFYARLINEYIEPDSSEEDFSQFEEKDEDVILEKEDSDKDDSYIDKSFEIVQYDQDNPNNGNSDLGNINANLDNKNGEKDSEINDNANKFNDFKEKSEENLRKEENFKCNQDKKIIINDDSIDKLENNNFIINDKNYKNLNIDNFIYNQDNNHDEINDENYNGQHNNINKFRDIYRNLNFEKINKKNFVEKNSGNIDSKAKLIIHEKDLDLDFDDFNKGSKEKIKLKNHSFEDSNKIITNAISPSLHVSKKNMSDKALTNNYFSNFENKGILKNNQRQNCNKKYKNENNFSSNKIKNADLNIKEEIVKINKNNHKNKGKCFASNDIDSTPEKALKDSFRPSQVNGDEKSSSFEQKIQSSKKNFSGNFCLKNKENDQYSKNNSINLSGVEIKQIDERGKSFDENYENLIRFKLKTKSRSILDDKKDTNDKSHCQNNSPCYNGLSNKNEKRNFLFYPINFCKKSLIKFLQ